MGEILAFMLLCIMVLFFVWSILMLFDIDLSFRSTKEKKKKPLFKQGEFGLANKYDAYAKCVKIIKSCKTLQQWTRAGEMADFYDKVYDDDDLRHSLWTVWNYFEPEGGWQTEYSLEKQ